MIMIRLMGGLGNQMFQYATGLALSKKLSTELKIDLSLLGEHQNIENLVVRSFELSIFPIEFSFASKEEINKFNPTSPSLLFRLDFFIRKILKDPLTYVAKGPGYDPNVLRVKNNRCIVGGLQSYKYFQEVEQEVKAAFHLSAPNMSLNRYGKELYNSPHSVAIHVRRTDYINNPLYAKILGALPFSYYESAISLIKKLKPQSQFFVFSDDPNWCRQNFRQLKDIIIVANEFPSNQASEDFFLMQQCRHFIISNSTFAWWASWLGKKEDSIIVAPQDWSADGSQNTSDRIPQEWIKI